MSPATGRIQFYRQFFSEKQASVNPDVVVCRMTLEHIPHVREFLGMIRRALGDQSKALVFFQVPDVTRILEETAFWDLYYEHCSYFSPVSLERLFSACSFEVQRLTSDYAGQYLLVEAAPTYSMPAPACGHSAELERFTRTVREFEGAVQRRIRAWNRFIQHESKAGRRIVLWGGGSKAVAFLTTLGVMDPMLYVVDINPHKHGTYIAGTGQRIVAPDSLREHQPDIVLIMNPVYKAEVEESLQNMGVRALVMTVDETPDSRVLPRKRVGSDNE